LSRVQKKLNKDGYKIVVYDSYRPQKAVNHFVRWADDPNALQQKAKYYPYIDKSLLFDQGYIAKKSGHSRGSTVDLSIIKIKDNLKPIDFKLRTLKNSQVIMLLDDGTEDFGSSFDLFSEASHPTNDLVDFNFI
jgi:zinc D-Ala-D-Ala dipeptidase